MTPRERAEQVAERYREDLSVSLVELITTAIQAASNEELERGRRRLASEKSAFNAAREDIAKLTKERDDAMATARRAAAKGLECATRLAALSAQNATFTSAHDRQVAARVLRETGRYYQLSLQPNAFWFAEDCLDTAYQYECGKREVPGA